MFKSHARQKAIDKLIDEALIELDILSPTEEQYLTILSTVERLIDLNARKAKGKVSPDTIAIIAANLLGMVLVLYYEQAHVVASKTFGMLLKPKI